MLAIQTYMHALQKKIGRKDGLNLKKIIKRYLHTHTYIYIGRKFNKEEGRLVNDTFNIDGKSRGSSGSRCRRSTGSY